MRLRNEARNALYWNHLAQEASLQSSLKHKSMKITTQSCRSNGSALAQSMRTVLVSQPDHGHSIPTISSVIGGRGGIGSCAKNRRLASCSTLA